MYRNRSGHTMIKLLAAVLLATPLMAQAENQALEALLKALNSNGTIDDKTYRLIREIADKESKDIETGIRKTQELQLSQFKPEQSIEQIVDQRIAHTQNSFKPKVRLGGRIQIDAAAYDEDSAKQNNGSELRRARMFAQGNLGNNWGFKLQYDFTATGNKGIQDAYLDYKGFESANIRLGHFKEPFSLQNITSSKNVLFTERGLPHVFAEGRNIGIQAASQGENWSLSAGIFGDGRDGASDENEGWGLSGRGTFAPIKKEDHYLHLGLSLSYRATGSENKLRFSERPESHVTNTKILDTGNIDADTYLRSVLEAAYVHGPFNLQAEYYHTSIERIDDNNPDLDFTGYYIESGWFLTGESMNYNSSSGNFGKIKPVSVVGDGGWGAWQLAARYSSLDLSDQDISGGDAQSMTLGVNWYATDKLRFSFNYVDILDVEGGPGQDDTPSAFQFRSQLAF